METIIIALGTLAGIGAILISGAIVDGFIIYKFYSWFILPISASLPHITFIQSIGLGLCLTLFKTSTYGIKKDETISKEDKLIVELVQPLVLLSIGYLIKTIFLS